ncbi:MAG: phosphoribosylformylglycinamidine synthase subunit PurL [Methanobrevibacter sp.]|jgi:phosphoribosylformylglycinamidine synthase|nr:phosphoribosylformylglycinamidine synthase subunit PurL [Candidatus Methanoflexus mossambicus]
MSLTDSEMEYIVEELGRVPNPLEEGMLDIMFSEHCSYKSSRPFLRMFPTEGENIIMGPGDDAGLVSITDELALAVGMESHNHPSAVEPYGGAGTGIGGILRDIISMGAMPIALLDSLRFGPLEDEKSRYLFEHVVKGISDYGNRVGVPTVGGEVEFDPAFRTNPLVNVMCAGLVKKEDIVKGIAPNPGDVFLLMGGTTGRDGMGGVVFASEELTSKSELEDRPAVQVGDPFTKKRVLEASLEILEKIDVSGVKDLGGGGITCCISELADKCENGAIVDLQAIPLRETGMTPYEIMLSESQERMIFVVNPKYVEEIINICNKHEIPAAVVGEVTDANTMIIKDGEEIIADLPTRLLADPPYLNREIRAPADNENKEEIAIEHPPIEESILKILSSPNIASKKWVYAQYDHEVQIRTVIKPGDDAAVLKVDDNTAIALSCDCNSIHTKLSPYNGGAGSLAEAIRNVISMGATPYAVVDCLNFGNPENPEILWQFSECIKGMSDLATAFDTPVISGNVSFYNETEGIKINPTPAVGVIGVMNLENIRTMDFKSVGDKILIVGNTYNEINGSEYHRTIHNIEKGKPPEIKIDDEINAGNSILNAVSNDKNKDITAIHDISAGGIAIALSEMAIAGNLGCEINLNDIPITGNIDENELLFSETYGRYLMSVKAEKVEEVIANINVPVSIIGEVKSKTLKIKNKNSDIVDIEVDTLKNSYSGVIEKYMT